MLKKNYANIRLQFWNTDICVRIFNFQQKMRSELVVRKRVLKKVLIPEFPARAFPGTTLFDALEQRFRLFTQH